MFLEHIYHNILGEELIFVINLLQFVIKYETRGMYDNKGEPNVNEDFEWQICVSVGSLVVINMTPVQGVDEGGSACVGAGVI